jgi:hypothetical protein
MEDTKLEQTLRKEISRELDNELETIKVKVIKRKLFYKGDIDWLNDFFAGNDDYEELYYNGVHYFFDNGIICLSVDKFLDFCDDYLNDTEDYKDDNPNYTFVECFRDILTPYKGYELWF